MLESQDRTHSEVIRGGDFHVRLNRIVPVGNVPTPLRRKTKYERITRAAELNPDRLKDVSVALFASPLTGYECQRVKLCGFRWEKVCQRLVKNRTRLQTWRSVLFQVPF